MRSVKLQLIPSRTRVACAAFALVLGLATASFVVMLFGHASVASAPPAARMDAKAGGAVAAEQQRRPIVAPG